MKTELTLEQVMTPFVHTIERSETLAAAERKMFQLNIRHLVVEENGKVVGLLSERDIHLAQALLKGDQIALGMVMAHQPYTAPKNASLDSVCLTMAQHKYGSAVVVDDQSGKLVGIFSTVDALTTLFKLLTKE